MEGKQRSKDPADFLPLSQVMYHMLLCLTNDIVLHGYGIKLEIKERTRGALNPDVGTTYQYLKKMRMSGLIAQMDGQERRRPRNSRRSYKLTKLGEQVLFAEYERLKRLLEWGRAKGVHLANHAARKGQE